MRGEDMARYLRWVGGKRGGRKKGKERKKREGFFLPGVMEFILALCLRLSSFDREEATIGIHTYLPHMFPFA